MHLLQHPAPLIGQFYNELCHIFSAACPVPGLGLAPLKRASPPVHKVFQPKGYQ